MDPIRIAFGLAQVAPSILRWLTGKEKAEAAAQQVVKIAEQVTGRADPKILEALQADPALVLQFRQVLATQESKFDKAYFADRADARVRDVKLHQAGHRNTRADLMVVGAVVGLIACLVALVSFRDGLPGEAVGIISTVAGIFGACLRDAFAFEFGSSRGSREKDELLARR